jgi:hypothetical protein
MLMLPWSMMSTTTADVILTLGIGVPVVLGGMWLWMTWS